eukprot:4032400-Pleurochrysis_carterae.AAC.1
MAALVSARMALFRSICLPSVAAQTDQRFVWIIYVDETLPAVSYNLLVETASSLPNAAVVRVERRSAARAYEAPCAEQLRRAGRWSEPDVDSDASRAYISTRLDADDALPVETMAM